MTYDTLGMIRRGWQDGAATVAPHVPGIADLLEHRLAEAIRLDRLDEVSLLSIVDEATQLAANSGAVDIAPALSKRLRRHVYEYLLSLDAAADANPVAPVRPLESPDGRGLLIGVDEVAALRRGQPTEPRPAIPGSNGNGVRWFEPVPAAAEDAESGAWVGQGPPSTLPQFSFHLGDPDDVAIARPSPDGVGPAGGHPEAPGPFSNGDILGAEAGPAPLRRASFADPSTWPRPAPPALRGGHDLPAPGTPLQEPPAPAAGPQYSLADGAGFQDLGSWPAARSADGLPASGFEDTGRWSSRWPAPEIAGAPQPAGPGAPADPAGAEFGPAEPRPHLDQRESWRDATEAWLGPGATGPGLAEPEVPPGWSVREPEAVELHLSPPPGSVAQLPEVPTDDVSDADLVALRASVDARLRKKRCDDAAAVLQQAAQELGGEAVAELALDAGDRCRTLGKRNAALNCYLAASRADPVYEPPLARLADICIDDQDIDLAVSYLERIARLTRLRGDTRGALRIYRKIATIAPYRDDVLEMLMRAQTTGRIDP